MLNLGGMGGMGGMAGMAGMGGMGGMASRLAGSLHSVNWPNSKVEKFVPTLGHCGSRGRRRKRAGPSDDDMGDGVGEEDQIDMEKWNCLFTVLCKGSSSFALSTFKCVRNI